MGLAAASHFIVNVARKSLNFRFPNLYLSAPSSFQSLSMLKNSKYSHRSRTQRLRHNPRELLLCLRRLFILLPRHCVLLLSVSLPSTI